jgi:hypothetical protein
MRIQLNHNHLAKVVIGSPNPRGIRGHEAVMTMGQESSGSTRFEDISAGSSIPA